MLFYRQAGAGAPLVLLHGLFGSLENLGALARVLAQDFLVYSVDLPNHGRSPHVSGADLPVMAQQLGAWMDDIELSKAHLVGHSLGGKVAMELALSDSAKVDRLVVMDIAPIAYPPRHDDVFAALFAVDPQQIERREQAECILSEHIDSPQLRTFLLKNLVKSEQGFAWRMNLTDLHDQYRRLIDANREGCFDGDVLFLKGAESDYLTEAAEPDIRRRFPKVKLRIVSQTGHWLHAEKPELVGKLIGQYLMR